MTKMKTWICSPNTFRTTTKGFYLGTPEAEGENRQGGEGFADFYADFLNIHEKINQGDFIIVGRKGSGKSAIAKDIMLKSNKNDGDQYAILIKPEDFEMEKLLQNLPQDATSENLFEWIILTRLVSMILQTSSYCQSPKMRALKEFERKNTGRIGIDQYMVVSATTENSYEINFSPLKKVFSGIISKVFKATIIKAPYWHLIPALRDIVKDVLSFQAFEKFRYYVMFDDLDKNFKLYQHEDKKNLLNLIRVSKKYNNEILVQTKARILIFMRDDVERQLIGIDSDTNKIFGSYSYKLIWYNYESCRMRDTDILLRRFFNKRIQKNFEKRNIKYDINDPWISLVDEYNKVYGEKGAFHFILDMTFYRPRDLINLFKDIGNKSYKIPLQPEDMKQLIRNYIRDVL